MDATIVIATKDRRDDLARALASALGQEGADIEVLVVDDGSRDGTAEMVRESFPGARLLRHTESKGYIVRRNEAATEAQGRIIFSIDDDAEFSTPSIVKDTLRLFQSDEVGVVAIPFIDVNRSDSIRQKAADDVGVHWTALYVGTAHALRRDLFLELSGYRSALTHQGEERDYSIRLLEAGHGVRLGYSDTILHYESPRRDWRRMDYYGRRNDVLFAWQNVPWPYVVPHLLGTILKGLWLGVRLGRLRPMLEGVRDGLVECVQGRHERKPASGATYREFRRRARGVSSSPE